MEPDIVPDDDPMEERDEPAKLESLKEALALTDRMKTVLGYKGEDQIKKSMEGDDSGSVTNTNNGATILNSLHTVFPIAKVLVEISKKQEREMGDGTASVVVLAGEFLREVENLVATKIHPENISAGYQMASEHALAALRDRVIDLKGDTEKLKEGLRKIAMTTLSSKILSQVKDYFANMAVDAVMRCFTVIQLSKGINGLKSIQIIKKPGGSLTESFLEEGFILDKSFGIIQSKRIEDSKILVASTLMDTEMVKLYSARVASGVKVFQRETAEREKMRKNAQKIADLGINCFVNTKLTYNFPEEPFAGVGVLTMEHANMDDAERLSLVTGGEIALTFDNPASTKLGHCKVIKEFMVGEEKLVHFSGVPMGQACTIVLRGASKRVLDEVESSLRNVLHVLIQTVKDSRVLLGGGWPEMVMAKAIDELARNNRGDESHAIRAFSRALLALPTAIAENAGLEVNAEWFAQLRAFHEKKDSNVGIDIISKSVGEMAELGIFEAFKVKEAVLLSATKAVVEILKDDNIITSSSRKRKDRTWEDSND